MKKTLMVFACTALLAASLSACGSKPAENKDTGTAYRPAAASSSSSRQQQENTLTGSLDEKKNGHVRCNGMPRVPHSLPAGPPMAKGLDDAEGDSKVTVTCGHGAPGDSFLTAVVSVESGGSTKLKTRLLAQAQSRCRSSPCADSVALRLSLGKNAKSPAGDRFSVSPGRGFTFRTSALPCPEPHQIIRLADNLCDRMHAPQMPPVRSAEHLQTPTCRMPRTAC